MNKFITSKDDRPQTLDGRPLVSVIVPIYKAERFIHKCVDGILAQTYPHLEVILVDDGSPDRCGTICDGYADRDRRVRVIHQPNGGVSRARNAGIELSTGSYIAFVDADDQIAPAYIEGLLTANSGGMADTAPMPDLVIGGFVSEERRFGRRRVHHTTLPDEFYQGKEQLAEYFNKHFCKLYAGVPWGKIYRADLLKDNQIRFDESIRFGEDFVFNLECLKHCNTISLVSSTKYRFTTSEITVEEKYRLGLREIEDYCRVVHEKTAELSKIWETNVNCNALIDIEISMYPLREVFANPAPYEALYEKYGSTSDLFSNYHCSPVLRGIHMAKGYLKTFRLLSALRLLLAVRRHYGDIVPTLTYHGLDKYISRII